MDTALEFVKPGVQRYRLRLTDPDERDVRIRREIRAAPS
jgi:hypothetical protein